MSADSTDEDVVAQRLSALVDGEVDPASVGGACGAWRESAQARSTWHAYHLIGDVLRSEDLASTGARDADFLGRLRERLALEPVVLAPQAVPAVEPVPDAGRRVVNARRSRRWTWMAPGAVAAGFVAVAGVLVVTRSPEPVAVETAAAPTLPSGASTSAGAVVPVAAPPARAVADASAEPEALVANGKLIRDARLDRYLAAHKQFAGSSALGVPSAFLRSATTDAAANR